MELNKNKSMCGEDKRIRNLPRLRTTTPGIRFVTPKENLNMEINRRVTHVEKLVEEEEVDSPLPDEAFLRCP